MGLSGHGHRATKWGEEIQRAQETCRFLRQVDEICTAHAEETRLVGQLSFKSLS